MRVAPLRRAQRAEFEVYSLAGGFWHKIRTKREGVKSRSTNTRAPQAWRAFPAHCRFSKNVGITGEHNPPKPPNTMCQTPSLGPAVPDPAQCRRAPFWH